MTSAVACIMYIYNKTAAVAAYGNCVVDFNVASLCRPFGIATLISLSYIPGMCVFTWGNPSL